MSRSLSDLDCEFSRDVAVLLDRCLSRGFEMKPHSTLRTPWDQAKLWRKSRSRETIEYQIRQLISRGQPFIASVIEEVGPQSGPLGRHVTWVVPGYSWHNWGEAVDCHWEIDGKAVWSTTLRKEGTDGASSNGYEVYAEIATSMGLFAGGTQWGKDWPHVHKQAFGSPASVMSYAEVEEAMKERFQP